MAYNTLTAGVGWLKNVDLKAMDPQTRRTPGVSWMDLIAAQTAAVVRIRAEPGRHLRPE